MWKAPTGAHRICCRPEIPTILPSPYRRGLGSVLSEVRLDAVETNGVEGVRSHKAQRRLRQTIMHDSILAFERIAEKHDRLTFSCSRQKRRGGEGKVSLLPKATTLRPPRGTTGGHYRWTGLNTVFRDSSTVARSSSPIVQRSDSSTRTEEIAIWRNRQVGTVNETLACWRLCDRRVLKIMVYPYIGTPSFL